MNTEVLVTAALSRITGRHAAECSRPELLLFEHLGVDSLALLELVETLQKKAYCEIPDEVTGQLKTVADLNAALRRCAGTPASRMARSEEYLRGHRSLHFERAARFRATGDRLRNAGLNDSDILVDLGAGMTELDYYLRAEYGWRGRYVPLDAWVDGSFDLGTWQPARHVGWYAALEVLEHMEEPASLVERMKRSALGGFVITTPNADKVDVLRMDPTHVTALDQGILQSWGLRTTLHNFYGQYQDGIAGVWTR